MPREKVDLTYIWDIVDAAKAVAGFVAGKTFADYEANRMLRRTVEREVEIIARVQYLQSRAPATFLATDGVPKKHSRARV